MKKDVIWQTFRRVLSFSRAQTLCLVGAMTLALIACGGDDDPIIFKPTLPSAGGDALTSVTHLGSVMACYDWKLTYNGGRLVAGVGTLRDSSSTTDGTFSYTSSITYGTRDVAVTNSSGEVTDIALNTAGYIARMSVNSNSYEFTYDSDGHVTAWKKTVVETSFGQAVQYYSSALLTYDDGNLVRIVYTETGNPADTLEFTPSSLVNTNGLLPETVGKELGFLSFEHLYYAGLLGRPSENLVESLSFKSGSNATENYIIDFEYSMKNGNTVLCNYHTPDGGVASVSYGY